jgi:Gpi18-like mannosyltransferase
MLPMYRVKTLYVSLIAALSPYFGEVGAIRFISLISTLATGLCVGLWLFREKALAYAPAAAGVLMIAGYPDIARLGSPDALFMALFTFGLYALHRNREMLSVFALFLAFMVRADTIAFLGILAVLFALLRQISLGAFGAFIVAAIAYSFLSSGAGHPGWWTHFWFSNVAQQLTMEGFHPEFSVPVYLKALASGLVRCVTELAWPGLLIILIASWAFVRSSLGKMDTRAEVIFLALVGGIIARFILFPLPDARVHGAYLTPLFPLLIPSIKTLLSVWKPAQAA